MIVDDLVVEWKDARDDAVRERHGLVSGLLGEPGRVPDVSVEESIAGTLDTLIPESAFQPPWPPPHPLQRPHRPRRQ